MTLQYGQYFMSGSVDEVIEFITKTTPCRVSTTTNLEGLSEEDAANFRKVFNLDK